MIYPIILNSYQPAFLKTETPYKIYFQFSSFQDIKEIKHIQIRLAYQSNDITIGNVLKYPDGIIYKNFNPNNKENGFYYVVIELSDLITEWVEDTYYKAQIRCGAELLWTDQGKNFSDWKYDCISNQSFSEWSTIMMLKCIFKPKISILDELISIQSPNPYFYGRYFNQGNEPESLFKFKLYSGQNLIEESEWLRHNEYNDNGNEISGDSYQFKHAFEDNRDYSLIYLVQTENQYVGESSPYNFRVQLFISSGIEGLTFSVQENEANGSIDFYLTTQEDSAIGDYIISRYSELDNFQSILDIYYFSVRDSSYTNKLIFSDRTIEYGIQYKYILTRQSINGLRSLPLYDSSYIKTIYFEDVFISDKDRQLCLNLNTNISSFKKVLFDTKKDTLGGKYPIIQRNGNSYYTEMAINGLISLQSDINQTFFERSYDMIDCNLTKENVLKERKYRDEVLKFLTNGQYKIFRSATEGNFIIYLTNISLSPVQGLNRFLYQFQATAYEVKDYTFENLKKYNLYNSGEFLEPLKLTGLYRTSYIGNITGKSFSSYNYTNIIPLMDAIVGNTNYHIKNLTFHSYKGFETLEINLDGQDMIINNMEQLNVENDPTSILIKSPGIPMVIKVYYNDFNYQYPATFEINNTQISKLYIETFKINDSILSSLKLKAREEIQNIYFHGMILDKYLSHLDIYINEDKTKMFLYVNTLKLVLNSDKNTIIDVLRPNGIVEQVELIANQNCIINLDKGIRDIFVKDDCVLKIDFTSTVQYGDVIKELENV